MTNKSLKNLIAEKIAETRKYQKEYNQKLNEYCQELERKIGSITSTQIKEIIKKEINFVYGINYDGKLRYQDGDIHKFQLFGFDFKFPERLTFEEMTRELFAEPQDNNWQKIIRFLLVSDEFTSREIDEENLIKSPALKLKFSDLKKMGFNPRIKVFLYRPGIQNKANLGLFVECEKGELYQES